MSFVFPRNNERGGWALDLDALNENFQHVVSEIQGNLGEHNWKKNSFSNTDDLEISESESPIVCRNSYKEGSAFDVAGTSGLDVPQTSPAIRQWKVPNSYDWTTIGDGASLGILSQSLTTRGGLLWISASFQQHGRWDSWTATEGTELPGVRYSICIDGTIIHETIPGCMDTGNDRLGSAIGVRMAPYLIDLVYPITPGNHLIEVKACLGQGLKEQAYDQKTDFYMIDSRELIIIELR